MEERWNTNLNGSNHFDEVVQFHQSGDQNTTRSLTNKVHFSKLAFDIYVNRDCLD